jgi:hypothetical protein
LANGGKKLKFTWKSAEKLPPVLWGWKIPTATFPGRNRLVTKNANKENLIKTKLKLAEKYQQLAQATTSRPKRKTLLWHVARYRHQAEQIAKR